MNIHKKLFVGIALLLSPLLSNASVPCGTSAPGVLNVGILPDNLPWSDWDSVTDMAIGFDPLLITQAAKLLGYDTVNFIGFGSVVAGITALNAGEIDVFADSSLILPASAPYSTIGVVTDISDLSLPGGEPLGWKFNLACCHLALLLEAAVTQLVENGTYARILQDLRLNDLTNGLVLGIPRVVSPSGILQEPFDFASSELGTIPATCNASGSLSVGVSLPQTNCISAYLQTVCTPSTPFTGATGIIPT